MKTVIWSIVSVILLILRIAIVVVGSISGAYLSIGGFFGVYGMLAISLLLLSGRHIISKASLIGHPVKMEFLGPERRTGVHFRG